MSVASDTYVQWTSWFIMHTANNFKLCQDACDSSTCVDAWPHCRLKLPFYRTPENICINFTLPETRVTKLHDGCYGIDLPGLLVFMQLFLKAKKRSSRQALKCVPTVVWRLLSTQPLWISAQTLYCQKLSIHTYSIPYFTLTLGSENGTFDDATIMTARRSDMLIF